MSSEGAKFRSPYPDPPAFYRLYSEETKRPDHADHALLYTPPEPIPSENPWEKFGQKQMAKLRNQELPDGVKVLYSVDANGKVNYSKELRRLNRKLMDKFVEVLRNSTQSADAAYEAQAKTIIEEMDLIFINMTQMLNILRAHQGRQTIISALDEQAARKNRQAEELEKGIEEIMAELRARNIDITEVERQAKMIDDGADDDDDDCESR